MENAWKGFGISTQHGNVVGESILFESIYREKNLELIASLNGGKEDDVRKAILAVGLSPDDSRKYKNIP